MLIDRRDGYRMKVLMEAARLQAADRLSRDFILAQQGAALAALLNHARSTIPVWKDRIECSDIAGADTLKILRDIPILSKEELQQDMLRFVSSSSAGARDSATGGSSGIPLRFKVDRMRQIAGEASHIWANGMSGWRYGERIAMLWGSDRDVREALADTRHALRCWIENIRWYNAFDMGEDRMADYHRAMTRSRPHLIVAYAGSALAYADYLQRRRITPHYPLKGIVTSAEVLTDAMRSTIETVFQKPVFDRYGSREFGPVAAECPERSGMHINEMDCVLEIQSDDPCSIPGPILITYLRNYAMPFIRYDTGDLGVFMPEEECACGRQTRRLARVIGRQSDIITTASGRQIHGEWFTHLMYGLEGIRQFQLIQETRFQYRLVLVADWHTASRHENMLREKILNAVGPESIVNFEYVQHIYPMPSGKHRFTVSMVGR